MKKKWLPAAVAVLLLIALVFCSDKKGMAVNHVLRNREQLTAYALQCMKQPERNTRYGSWDTQYDDKNDVVMFQVSYIGFGSQSDERGFYYSPEDLPNGLGNDLEETVVDSGLMFLGEGDNYTYGEQITDHWYWYEIHW